MADPALLFHDTSDRPGTHVLLVGIGDYPWLEGGDKCNTLERKAAAMGMEQLGAAPKSMRALANWFLAEFDNPNRQLASLSLILSEPQPAQYQHPSLASAKTVPRGTLSDVKNAVAGWVKRANLGRDNSLVFGFCGHGVQSGNPVLLCRDYAKDINNRFDGAIDFEQVRIALSTKQPDTQLLFVDACRTPDIDNSLLGQVTPGDALLGLSSLTTRGNAPALQSVHFATSLYTQAWGRDEEPSLFSKALLEALAGGGADHTANWWVTTSRLHSALSTYLARISREEGISQRPAAQTQDFVISKPMQINVPLHVRSPEPAIWAERIVIEARRGPTSVVTFRHEPPVKPGFTGCSLKLTNPSQRPSDVLYDVHALFDPASAFLDCKEQIIAYPPEVTCDLPVSKRP